MEIDSDNASNSLLHVICVPFRIRAKPGVKVCLDSTAEVIKGSAWKQVDNQYLHGVPSEKWHKPQQYQARAYFHPFVQRFLFDPHRVRRFVREDIDSMEIDFFEYKVEAESTAKETIELDVRRCELTLFQPDIGVLLIEVSPTQTLSLKQTQSILDGLRRLYPPYLAQFDKDPWKSGHCPGEVRLMADKERIGGPGLYRGESTGEALPDFFNPYFSAFDKESGAEPLHLPCANHWQKLLEPFDTTTPGSGKLSAHQFGDDRAPTLSYLALEDPVQISEGNWMRLCFADEPGDNKLPYARRFMGEFEKRFCYDRYWYSPEDSSLAPSRILNCGYSFTWVGSCEDSRYFTDKNNGAVPTFRNIYVTMGVIAHFQRASLLAASERLTEMVKRDGAKVSIPDRDKVRDFYDQFMEFTQHFWFDEISPQEQGQELFQMWRKHLRIQELYDEVRQELKDLVEYAELRAAGELNQTVSYFGLAAIGIAIISAIAGIFGMNAPDPKDMPPSLGKSIATSFPENMWWMSVLLSVSLVVITVVVAIFAKRNVKIKLFRD